MVKFVRDKSNKTEALDIVSTPPVKEPPSPHPGPDCGCRSCVAQHGNVGTAEAPPDYRNG